MSQLNLFTSKTCDRCGQNPGTKPGSPQIWNGFRDQDLNILVCWSCRSKHYRLKAEEMKLENGMLYSELPELSIYL